MDNKNWPDRRQRHRVQLEAELLQGDGTISKTIVSDLSLEGCRLVGWFRIGDAVTLRLSRIGVVRGTVRWAMNGQAGVRFLSNVEG
jgi:hypothetical protein